MIIKRFHQFVILERGPVKTAIIDFLKGDVYQVENTVIELFKIREYEEIADFIQSCKKEELIVEMDEKLWIPRISFEKEKKEEKFREFSFNLEIDEGADLTLIEEKLKGFSVSKVIYYGKALPVNFFPSIEKKYQIKNFQKCKELSMIERQRGKVNDSLYAFNLKYNTCWGKKIAVTSDGLIRPCIYSQLTIGDLKNEELEVFIGKIKEYWSITKDDVEKCKDCELRYVCFDCREIARRSSNNLFGTNPYCKYDPYTGEWAE